jgi:hypothetical protein
VFTQRAIDSPGVGCLEGQVRAKNANRNDGLLCRARVDAIWLEKRQKSAIPLERHGRNHVGRHALSQR